MTAPLETRGRHLVDRLAAAFAARRAGLITAGEFADMVSEAHESALALERDRREAWKKLAA